MKVKADCKVDYIAFTVPIPAPTPNDGLETAAFMLDTINSFCDGSIVPVASGHDWEISKCSGFYSVQIRHEESKIVCQWGDVNSNVYVQVPGQACEYIRATGFFDKFLQKVSSRCSRIDVCCDLECEHKPRDIVGNYYEGRGKSYQRVISPDGETVYIGSRKSERFVRVYRYSHPHPRSRLLRIEFESKGDFAKIVASAVVEGGIEQAFYGLYPHYHWDVDLIDQALLTTGKIKGDAYTTDNSATVLWLLNVVAPSLIQAHRNQLLDAHQFFSDFVEPHLK